MPHRQVSKRLESLTLSGAFLSNFGGNPRGVSLPTFGAGALPPWERTPGQQDNAVPSFHSSSSRESRGTGRYRSFSLSQFSLHGVDDVVSTVLLAMKD
jgi:hypothetical protein